jgi:RNA polymerase sigma factor (sigma-70 family)
MTDDAELLRRYAEDRSEAAFAELVGRHVDLVYSSALRQCRSDHHRAQEVTQMVFADLARKASSLVRHPVLPAWLHRSSHLAALDLFRREGRRQRYERAAGDEAAAEAPVGEAVVWAAVGPVLDEAIDALDERDRQAILLRYFGNRPYAEVGQRLRLSENAARMRVDRALEKLHGILARRGITSSSAALAAVLSGSAVAAAPAGVAIASTSAAMSAAAGAGAAWLALMTSTKFNALLTAAILVAGSAVVAVQKRSEGRTAAEQASLSAANRAIPGLRELNKRLAKDQSQARDAAGDSAAITSLQDQIRSLEAKADAAKSAQGKTTRSARLDDGQPVYDISRLDQMPKMMNQNRPKYPAEMQQAGSTGEALVDFVVGADGLVYNAYAATSTDKAFAESAVEAVSQWVFKPGQVGGQNVYTHMQVPIVFSLSPGGPPPPTAASWF